MSTQNMCFHGRVRKNYGNFYPLISTYLALWRMEATRSKTPIENRTAATKFHLSSKWSTVWNLDERKVANISFTYVDFSGCSPIMLHSCSKIRWLDAYKVIKMKFVSPITLRMAKTLLLRMAKLHWVLAILSAIGLRAISCLCQSPKDSGQLLQKQSLIHSTDMCKFSRKFYEDLYKLIHHTHITWVV